MVCGENGAADDSYGAPPAADAAAASYGAPADEGYGAPADDAYGAPAGEEYDDDYYGDDATGADASYGAPAGDDYGAPADDAYGAPADDAYGAPGGDDYNYDDAAPAEYGAPADDAYGAPPADEAAATYETRDARGRFRGGRARTFGRQQSNNRRPAARPNNRRPAARPAAPARQQRPRGGRGLIPIPVPHRGPARNRLINRQAAAARG